MDLSKPQKFDRKDCLNWKFVDLSKPQKFDRKDCLNWKFIAMIFLHFHLHRSSNMNFSYIFHIKNLILAEDKRCSCSSSRGHGKILSKRPIPERDKLV